MELPRLVYIGDVTVENTRSGPVQLYRLLQNYPPDRLQIIESDLLGNSDAAVRLSGVDYHRMHLPLARLRYTRLQRQHASFLFLSARFRAYKIRDFVTAWKPHAVLSVANHYSWLTAGEIAERLNLPLHLIVHDDPLVSMSLPSGMLGRAEREFARVYRQAATRLCVCGGMASLFAKRFGVSGDVLYPIRAGDAAGFDAPADRVHEEKRSLTFAFAGTVPSRTTADAITALVDVLEPLGHRFLLFSNWSEDVVRRHRLDRPHVTVCPLAPPGQLVSQLRGEADVLFTPMSFAAADSWSTQVSFPSKLSDYSEAGLPLLIWGPQYCSAVQWALESPNSAIVVTDPSREKLGSSLAVLANGEFRVELAKNALRRGKETFSHEAGCRTFLSAVTGKS